MLETNAKSAGAKVLVAEDEEPLALLLRYNLEAEGYAVDVVHNGNDAVDWALAVEYDGILLDVMLPGRDGYAVCRELRDQKVKTPILMLTARDAVDDRVTGLDVGAHSAEVYLPGMLALRLGRPIEWDGRAMKVKDAPEAEPLIQKDYRSTWMI